MRRTATAIGAVSKWMVHRRLGTPLETRLCVADLELDLLKRTVRRAGQSIELKPREFLILEYLMRHAGQVVTRTMLLESVWDYHFDPQTNVIDVHMSRLRQKIDRSFDPPLLRTVRGAFYAWSIDRPRQQVDSELGQELRELASHYQTRGARALASEVARRVDQLPAGQQPLPLRGIATHSGARGKPGELAGSVRRGRPGADHPDPDSDPALPDRAPDPDARTHARRRSPPRSPGAISVSTRASSARCRLAAVGSLALVVFGGLAAGLGVSRNLLGRVEAMRDTIVGILGGRRQERVPVRSREGAFDAFDELADQFNRLLDDNERLLVRMREVTDDVAHDLRSPLSRMRARIEATLVTRPSAEDQTEALHAMLAEIDGMLDTFNALVHIAQIESRSVQEHMEILDLDEQAADAAELYQPVAEEAGLAFHTALAGGLRIRGNRHLLSQALTNLLDNAIKYSDEPGEITLESRRVGEHVEICVADRGPGIPEADRERVLQRFVRLDASRRTAGTGLGLSFVAAVADLHEATLRIEDNAPGLRVTLRFESRLASTLTQASERPCRARPATALPGLGGRPALGVEATLCSSRSSHRSGRRRPWIQHRTA